MTLFPLFQSHPLAFNSKYYWFWRQKWLLFLLSFMNFPFRLIVLGFYLVNLFWGSSSFFKTTASLLLNDDILKIFHFFQYNAAWIAVWLPENSRFKLFVDTQSIYKSPKKRCILLQIIKRMTFWEFDCSHGCQIRWWNVTTPYSDIIMRAVV